MDTALPVGFSIPRFAGRGISFFVASHSPSATGKLSFSGGEYPHRGRLTPCLPASAAALYMIAAPRKITVFRKNNCSLPPAAPEEVCHSGREQFKFNDSSAVSRYRPR